MYRYETWGLIVMCMFITGLLERYIEGYFGSERLVNAKSVIQRLHKRISNETDTRHAQTFGTVKVAAKWSPHDASSRDGEGVLRVTVVGARNLEASDKNGLSDPYAIVQYGRRRVKTQVRRRPAQRCRARASRSPRPTSDLAAHACTYMP